MPIYLITYDLNSPGQNYTDLLEFIRSYGTAHHSLMRSSWLIYDPTRNANELFNLLCRFIDQNDRLFVSEVTENFQGWLNSDVNEWLNTTLKLPPWFMTR